MVIGTGSGGHATAMVLFEHALYSANLFTQLLSCEPIVVGPFATAPERLMTMQI